MGSTMGFTLTLPACQTFQAGTPRNLDRMMCLSRNWALTFGNFIPFGEDEVLKP